MFTLFLKWIVGVLALVLLIFMLVDYRLEHSAKQAVFQAGAIPNPEPSGYYDGYLAMPNPFWEGKRFDDITGRGVNVFRAGYGLTNEGFSFVTYPGKGLKDGNHDVFKLDYDISDNPFWLRPFFDEIVQVGDNHYLGKMYLRFLPGHPFTLAFFELSR